MATISVQNGSSAARAPCTASRKAAWALCVLTLCGGTLVATHRGEFFPFSIYAMFSRAGRPWTRVLVREVSGVRDAQAAALWQDATLESLPGQALILEDSAINQNDVADYVKLTVRWTAERSEGMRALFREPLAGAKRSLLVYRVRGDVDESGEAQVVCTPILRLDAIGAEVNPVCLALRDLRPSGQRGPVVRATGGRIR